LLFQDYFADNVAYPQSIHFRPWSQAVHMQWADPPLSRWLDMLARVSRAHSAKENRFMPSEPGTVEFSFEGTVWHYKNPNTVYFVSVPEPVSADILALVGTSLNPWGTVPIDATVHGVTWYTSMFPRDGGRYYDLPLKLKILSALELVDGQTIDVRLSIKLPW
jgi:hypothetical protein